MTVLKATGIAAALVMGVVTPASADGLTTIRIKVTGCNGCKIFAHDSAHRDWSTVKHGYSRILDRAKVRNGKATLKVPTAQTPGMSFAVYDGPYSTGGGVPMVAVRYQGKAVGETVSEYEAAGAATGRLLGGHGPQAGQHALRRDEVDQPERAESCARIPPHAGLGGHHPAVLVRRREHAGDTRRWAREPARPLLLSAPLTQTGLNVLHQSPELPTD